MSIANRNYTIALGVLSWKAPETLIRTLESYRDSGLDRLVDHRLLYFNDMVEQDRSIAQRFGYEVSGGPNCGITGGMIKMAIELTGCDLVLLMQNDLPAVTDPSETERELTFVAEELMSGRAQVGNLRHRWLPGQGFGRVGKYLKFWPEVDRDPQFTLTEHSNLSKVSTADPIAKKLRRALRGSKAKQVAGGSYYLSSNPEKLHPEQIQAVRDLGDIPRGYRVDSSAMTYSDQSLMMTRDFYLETLVPYIQKNKSGRTINGFPDAEAIINHRPWWGQQHFKIAMGRTGIFSHDRRDGISASEHLAGGKTTPTS